jgi:carbonic anhydrase
METDHNFTKMLEGYQSFRQKYALGDESVMQFLSHHGQQPQAMVVACCDSRVDPGVILQCDPGDLFVVRNVANIVPPFEQDAGHHGTSAALEFGICHLEVKHLILLGHSQCGGIQALLQKKPTSHNDFIHSWVSLIESPDCQHSSVDDYAKLALNKSHQNCLSFPWLNKKVIAKKLIIHLWFFDIKQGEIFTYSETSGAYEPLLF